MKAVARRLFVIVAIVATVFVGSAPLAGATDEVCPFVKIKNSRHEVCLRLPY